MTQRSEELLEKVRILPLWHACMYVDIYVHTWSMQYTVCTELDASCRRYSARGLLIKGFNYALRPYIIDRVVLTHCHVTCGTFA